MVKIVTDSTADISPALAQQLGITVVPMCLHFGKEAYLDGIDTGVDEFYQRLETSSVPPTTSAPSLGEFVEVYKKVAQENQRNHFYPCW